MKSVMHHAFSQVPQAEIPRSVFNRSHAYKTTFNSGYLIPFLVDEVLPGDTFKCNANLFARMATQVVPVMDNLFMDTFYFFVPNRLVWDHWPNLMGEKLDINDTTEFLTPCLDGASVTPGDIYDYMGLPLGTITGNNVVNALPFRSYNLIVNEWFRDENLVAKLDVPTNDGPDPDVYSIVRRGKRHDYFTSCLPWPQKGDAIELPLGSTAPVYGDGTALGLRDGTENFGLIQAGGFANYDKQVFGEAMGWSFGGAQSYPAGTKKAIGVVTSGSSGLLADLSAATASTINSLRQAFQLQRMLERDARAGSRYTELIRSHFGVISPDQRLQRPEYLGGGSQRIAIHPVQQTSVTPPDGTGNATPMGSLAAFGIASGRSGFTKSFVEHGFIIGLVNVRADLTYQQGLPRMFSRRTRYDYYWPALAHIGEQAVLNKEIYFSNNPTIDNTPFGYQERFAEYRYFPSKITGVFRSNAPGTLDVWHLSQKFTELPVLNESFINDNPPIDRVVAVPTEPQFLFDSYIEMECARPMPVYSVPGLIDHF